MFVWASTVHCVISKIKLAFNALHKIVILILIIYLVVLVLVSKITGHGYGVVNDGLGDVVSVSHV